MELSLLPYSNPSRSTRIREKEQDVRISWWLGVHVDNKNYLGFWKGDTSLSQCLGWELLCWHFHSQETTDEQVKSGGRKRARKSQELVKKKISRENRMQRDLRGTKLVDPFTFEPLSLREAKRRRSEKWRKKTEKSKMLQALKKQQHQKENQTRERQSQNQHTIL